MTQHEEKARISFKYIFATLVAVVLTWLIHEFAHWSTGELLGNEMGMTLNRAYSKTGSYRADWHQTIISAAGPVITLMQAGVNLLRSQHSLSWYLAQSLF